MLMSVFINTILEFAAIILIFYSVLGTDFLITPAKKLLAVLMFTAQIILQAVSMKIFNTPVINTFSILIILIIIFNGSVLYKTCWLLVCSLAIVLTSYTVSNICYIIIWQFASNISLTEFLGIFDKTILIIFIISALALNKSRKQRQNIICQIERKSYFLVLFSCIIIKLLLGISELLFYKNITGILKNITVYLIFALVIMLMAAIIAFLKIQYQHNILQEKEELHKKYIEMEQIYYSQLEKKNNDLRAFRHDFNSHILVLQKLASGNKINELENYLHKISLIHTKNFYISTGNIAADVIINHFYNKLGNGILFKTSGYFQNNCFIENFDICTILSNLLSNASEALEDIDTQGTREIYLDIDHTPEHISFFMKNTFNNNKINLSSNLITSKQDKDNHGFGLENIRKTAEKYHGFIKTSYKNNMFYTYVVLNKPL